MAPIKFEEHIKEKLDQREIQPSTKAWENIAASIENTSQKNKHRFVWYAIAASVVGVLIASLFLFIGQEEELNNENTFVVKDKIENKIEASSKKSIILEDATVEKTKPIAVEEKIAYTEEKLNLQKSTEDTYEVAANVNLDKEIKAIDTKELNNEDLITSKIQDVIAQVDLLEIKNKSAITDAEIDALLRKAQNEILAQRIFKNNNNVDAMALLAEAEDELNISIRDQLFETLKNGYLKVRTAVADRNN